MSDAVFAGVMSGTSLDGIDVVLARFPEGSDIHPLAVIGSAFLSFPDNLKAELLALQSAGCDEIARVSRVALLLADLYAEAVRAAAADAKMAVSAIRAAGVHGQTIRHCPQQSWSYQVNQPARVAEQLGIDVVADFRSRDLAAGGQGAPLVPLFHKALLHGISDGVMLNVGGMANLTDATHPERVAGFDTGPGNVLMDGWYAQHHEGRFDKDGRWAASGKVLPELLREFLGEPYFAQVPPKSTGRDLFNARWLQKHLAKFPGLSAQDVQATLLALTAASSAQAVKQYAGDAKRVYICGGGAYNKALMARLAELLAPRLVTTTQAIGIAPQHVEALAFAWLAREATARRPLDLSGITGARRAVVLGAIYPGN